MMNVKRIVLAILACAWALAGCRPVSPTLSPRPAEVRELEGYASLRLTLNRQTAKSKFSFILVLPDQGRLQILDMLNRPVYEIYVDGEASYFILPSERVYWQGPADEIFEKFLGFRLSLPEMAGILSGGWAESRAGELDFKGWAFEKDREGRIVSGQSQDCRFQVTEFHSASGLPRQWTFKSQQSQGRLSLLSILFNRPVQDGRFRRPPLRDFELVGWDKIERILRNEN